MGTPNPYLPPEGVFQLTPAGRQELQASTTSLSPAALELMVRMDGRVSLPEIRRQMAAVTDAEFQAAVGDLRERGFLELAELDPIMLSLQVKLDRMDMAAAQVEAEQGLSVLKGKGYYVRIAREPRQRGNAPASAQGMTVVVVEDDPMLARFLQTLLQLEGFVVRTAADRAAIQSEMRRLPVADIVLLDVMLPDVDGFTVLARMREHPVLRDVPVIMLTGADSREAVIRGIAGGAAGYLTKPVDPDSLMRALRTVLGLPQEGEGA